MLIAVIATSAVMGHEIDYPLDGEVFHFSSTGDHDEYFSPYGSTEWQSGDSQHQIRVTVALMYLEEAPEISLYYANILSGTWWEEDHVFHGRYEGDWTVGIDPSPISTPTQDVDFHSGPLDPYTEA